MKNHSHYHQLIPVKVHEKFAWIANTISPKIKGYSDDNLKEVLSIISWNIRKDGKTFTNTSWVFKTASSARR